MSERRRRPTAQIGKKQKQNFPITPGKKRRRRRGRDGRGGYGERKNANSCMDGRRTLPPPSLPPSLSGPLARGSYVERRPARPTDRPTDVVLGSRRIERPGERASERGRTSKRAGPGRSADGGPVAIPRAPAFSTLFRFRDICQHSRTHSHMCRSGLTF